MATDVVMPQMGESIAEGTIVRWMKKVGDKVDRDEPLFEISTDKVDAEIPSPAAGVVSEIRVKEGETVPVNSVVAVIGAAPPMRRLRRARSRRQDAEAAPARRRSRPSLLHRRMARQLPPVSHRAKRSPRRRPATTTSEKICHRRPRRRPRLAPRQSKRALHAPKRKARRSIDD